MEIPANDSSAVGDVAIASPTRRNRTREFLFLFQNLKAIEDGECLERNVPLEDAILQFISYYQRHKAHIDKKYTNKIVFSELPNLCFENHIENRLVLAEILRSVDELPQISVPHLVLFVVMLGLTNRNLPDDIIVQRNKMKMASFSVLTYFLHHAYRQRLTFNDKRMMEMITLSNPIVFSKLLFFGDPKCLLALLQFGLRFDFPKIYGVRIHPIFLCAAELLTAFFDVERCSRYPAEKIALFCKNFKILLLSTRNPHAVTHGLSGTLMRYADVTDFEHLRHHLCRILPDLDFDLNRPSSLQHACRYVIRSRLHRCWRLPYGVWKLRLPRCLACYLNFSMDENKRRYLVDA